MSKTSNILIVCVTVLLALLLLRGQTLVVNVHHTLDLTPVLKRAK